jgi:hypothetical protein
MTMIFLGTPLVLLLPQQHFNRGVFSFLILYHGHYIQQLPVRQSRQLLDFLG